MSIISTIVWLVAYYTLFTPVAVVVRIFWSNPLALKKDPHSKTYWQNRPTRQFRPLTSQY